MLTNFNASLIYLIDSDKLKASKQAWQIILIDYYVVLYQYRYVHLNIIFFVTSQYSNCVQANILYSRPLLSPRTSDPLSEPHGDLWLSCAWKILDYFWWPRETPRFPMFSQGMSSKPHESPDFPTHPQVLLWGCKLYPGSYLVFCKIWFFPLKLTPKVLLRVILFKVWCIQKWIN